jgi:hypothetical protein
MSDAQNSNEQRIGRPFPKGVSGNPGGRPKGDGWFRKLCQKRTVRALKALDAALEDPDSRVSAAKALLEFGWGKAPAAGYVAPADGTHEQRALSDLSPEVRQQLAAAYLARSKSH